MAHKSLKIDKIQLTRLMKMSCLRSSDVMKLDTFFNVLVQIMSKILLKILVRLVKQFLSTNKLSFRYKLIGELDCSLREKHLPSHFILLGKETNLSIPVV